jgi:hypothetical protein
MLSGEGNGCNEFHIDFLVKLPRPNNLHWSWRTVALLLVTLPAGQHSIASQSEAQTTGEQMVNGVALNGAWLIVIIAHESHELVTIEALTILEGIQSCRSRVTELVLQIIAGFDDRVHVKYVTSPGT